MTFQIITLGCKVNAYESEGMKEKLLSAGFEEGTENVDIIIVNTCSVTNFADQKSRKTVRQLKSKFPNAITVVCGCSSENHERDFEEIDVDILLGNKGKSKIVSLLQEYLETKQSYKNIDHKRDIPFEDMHVTNFDHARAYLKIQDGCNNFCTYCIIPYVRGSIRSKEFSTAIKEAQALVESGHQEIVLTGIHTGSYGFGTNHDLTDLIHELSKIENLKRIRISSIEITELNHKFLMELENNPKICNHLHIPLQAGSDEILKRMNRKYNLKEFKEKIEEIRKIRPDINITTDCIVGFPYETEELFQTTLKTCEEIKFSKIHVFPYSIRKKTPASTMPNQVDKKTKHERSVRLCALSEILEKKYNERFIGKTVEVLIEEIKDGKSIGHTKNFLKVEAEEELERNTFYQIEILEEEKGILKGKVKVPVSVSK